LMVNTVRARRLIFPVRLVQSASEFSSSGSYRTLSAQPFDVGRLHF
jgi:hypothetical protein